MPAPSPRQATPLGPLCPPERLFRRLLSPRSKAEQGCASSSAQGFAIGWGGGVVGVSSQGMRGRCAFPLCLAGFCWSQHGRLARHNSLSWPDPSNAVGPSQFSSSEDALNITSSPHHPAGLPQFERDPSSESKFVFTISPPQFAYISTFRYFGQVEREVQGPFSLWPKMCMNSSFLRVILPSSNWRVYV